MPSARMKALMSISRLLLSVIMGAAVTYFWLQYGGYGGEFFAFGAGIITIILAFTLLNKLKGGVD